MKLRKILALVMALALVCATFTACGNDSSTSTTSDATTSSGTGSSEAEAGDTGASGDTNMDNYINMEPTSLNTLLATYAADFNVLNSLYETLLELDGNDVAQPAAAESYEVSEDGLTYTFHLRDDGVWSNGDPVTSADFVYAWQQALNPDVASDYAYMLFFIHNAEAYLNGEVSWDEVGVEAPDDSTIVVTLDDPLPYAPYMFTFKTMAPINQKFYEEVGADMYGTDADKLCTNGAYTIEEWSHNSYVKVKKNPDFHDADSITVPEITYNIVTSANSAVNSFLSGELDFVTMSTGELIDQVKNAGYEVVNQEPSSAFYMYVNCNNEYTSNVNLRRALALSFDKQAMIDAVYKNGNLPMTSFCPPAVMGANETSFQAALQEELGDLAPATGDVEAAKGYFETALSELGITAEDLNGKLSIDVSDDPTAQAQAAFYQEQWRQNLGIEVTINPMQATQINSNRQNGNYVMSISGWSPDYNDPMTFEDLWVTGGGNNDTGWSNAEYDQLIADATVETDENARQEMFYKCEQILFDEYPIIPCYWRADSYAINRDRVTGGERITAFQTKFFWADLA
ncbi:MAG: peptide ABC transporter substrate-binding protein [Acutalibacter sp.]|jgi:oligopeptide transport system substrate-binding protein